MNAPWTSGSLHITQQALNVVETAAVAAYGRDEEACGYLQGPREDGSLCDAAVELENLANKYHAADPEAHPRTGREYFKVNSRKFERAIEEGERAARPVKVFFHSHLDCGAYFSREDADSMTGRSRVCLVLSRNRGGQGRRHCAQALCLGRRGQAFRRILFSRHLVRTSDA
jgi:[CysO sulfur-carrier protein]-S-L-cysteine hydrolase